LCEEILVSNHPDANEPARELKQDAIWDFYQNKSPGIFDENTGRLAYLIKQIPKEAKVLDIGVGNGAVEEMALERGLDVSSLDPSSESIAALQKRLSLGDKARVGHSENAPFDTASFDYVVMSEVLEHLTTDVLEATVREVHRMLKSGGHFLITVPREEDLNANVVLCPHCQEKFHRWGHRQAFTRERLRKLLEQSFSVERCSFHKFITWKRRKGAALIAAVVKQAAHLCGVRLPDESIFVDAVRK